MGWTLYQPILFITATKENVLKREKTKREHKRRNSVQRFLRRNSILITAIAIVLVIAVIVMCVFIFGKKGNEKERFYGSYTYKNDVSSYVEDAMSSWMSTAILSEYVDMDECAAQVYVSINCEFKPDGTYMQYIDEAAYKECINEAYEAAGSMLINLFEIRLQSAGIEGYSEEEIADLFEDSFGITIEEYITSYIPDIMPSFEEMKEIVDYSCDFDVEDGILIRGEVREAYIIDETGIALMPEDGESMESYPIIMINEKKEEAEHE